MNVAKITFTIF